MVAELIAVSRFWRLDDGYRCQCRNDWASHHCRSRIESSTPLGSYFRGMYAAVNLAALNGVNHGLADVDALPGST